MAGSRAPAHPAAGAHEVPAPFVGYLSQSAQTIKTAQTDWLPRRVIRRCRRRDLSNAAFPGSFVPNGPLKLWRRVAPCCAMRRAAAPPSAVGPPPAAPAPTGERPQAGSANRQVRRVRSFPAGLRKCGAVRRHVAHRGAPWRGAPASPARTPLRWPPRLLGAEVALTTTDSPPSRGRTRGGRVRRLRRQKPHAPGARSAVSLFGLSKSSSVAATASGPPRQPTE